MTAAQRARWLAYVTAGWTAIEAAVGVWAAGGAGGVVLLAFGVDSLIEVVSGAAVIWRFSGTRDDTRERRAAQIVGWSLVLLGGFVAVDSVTALVRRHEPWTSAVGIVLTAATVVLMPVLARLKRRIAVEVNSHALAGDARQSDTSAWLSAITLGGLGPRAVVGWWWTDAAAAPILVPLIVRERIEVLRAKELCADCVTQSARGFDPGSKCP